MRYAINSGQILLLHRPLKRSMVLKQHEIWQFYDLEVY